MKRINLLITLIGILFFHTDLYSSPDFYFSNLNLKDGLSQISVLDILQDSKGYMWFATRNGLNRYDGKNFVVYKNDPKDSLSLSNNHIYCLAEDYNQNLWIGTFHGLNVLDMKTNRMTRVANSPYWELEDIAINCLLVDSHDRLWIGTGQGLYIYEIPTGNYRSFQHIEELKNKGITSICETHDGQFWIGTSGDGIWICNPQLHVQRHLTESSPDIRLSGNSVSVIYEDVKGNVWVGSKYTGLCRINLQQNTTHFFTQYNSPLNSNSIRRIIEYQGQLLIGTFDGLYVLDLNTDEIVRHSDVSLRRGYLTHFSVYALYVDKSQTLWVGTYSGGVNCSSVLNDRFVFHDPASILNTYLSVYGIMACGADDDVYIATEGGGILVYDYKDGSKYTYYPIEGKAVQKYNQNMVKCPYLEGDTLWCGTAKGAIYRFDLKKKLYTLVYRLPEETAAIYSILRDRAGRMWVANASEKGLICRWPDGRTQKDFQTADDRILPAFSARCLFELAPDVMLFGTRSHGLFRYDLLSKKYEHYYAGGKGSAHLLDNYVTSILKDQRGRIWIGTFGGGIALYEDGKGIIKSYTKDQGLIDNEVAAVVEDRKGNLWLSTTSGISCFNPEEESFVNYHLNNGIGIEEFTPHSGILLPNGEIAFGGNNGFITFNPAEIQQNSYVPSLVLNSLTINNRLIKPQDETGILNVVLDDVDKVSLEYNQNNLSIAYSALNYVFSDQNQYATFLHGYDKEWHYIGNRTEAYYTNLSPGTYVFEVKAANNDGVWQEKTRKLVIEIHPPLWRTWYAYSFYVVLVLTVLVLIMYYVSKKQKLERELYYQQQLQKQQDEFHENKIRMFTNFSHELRTPLTLVISPLQELVAMSGLTSVVRNKLDLVYSNAQRLLLLVNQLLDLRKSQEGKLDLHISKSNLIPFLEEIHLAFSHLAMRKSIHFEFEKDESSFYAWFDKSLVEKVVFNLLSNAIKFTPDNGRIVLSLKKCGYQEIPTELRTTLPAEIPQEMEFALISVSDSGCGIPEEELKHIFTPFYQVEEQVPAEVGTGLGLSLVHTIVKLHHGCITVDSSPSKGSAFTVYIPILSSAYSEQDIERGSSVADEVIVSGGTHEKVPVGRKWTVLLVEDNADVRQYVKEYLEDYYYIVEADNGADALELALQKYPDLVLSDIMMPKMDGLELCRRIKDDIQLEHIPVVLMTAKSMVEHIKEGFSVGADDYIVKPFNIEILVSRLQNILLSREKLKKLYGKKFAPDAMGIEIVSGDDRFTQKLFEVIEKNISNPDLNIDLLSSELGLSRSNLYRKLKAVTELSPTELIRNKRLEIAAKLLLESSYTISEVAVYAGFNSHAYFTSCFKNFYGYSPTEWVQMKKDQA